MRRIRLRRRYVVGGLAVLTLLLLLLFRAALLTQVARFLVVSEPPHPADVIVLLNGDERRAMTAAELYEAGYARQILVVETPRRVTEVLGDMPSSSEFSIRVLEALGVSEEAIVVVRGSGPVTSTREEAEAVSRYVRENDIGDILLVTSEFHGRRARWVFRRALRNRFGDSSGWAGRLTLVGSPRDGFDETNWWRHEDGLISVNNEYVKLLYYVAAYR